MRHLVVCCDGTWNTPDQESGGVPVPTNVVRLYNTLAKKDKDGNEQVKYYHPGVGTEGNWWEKLAGGGAGVGLSKNVMSGYKWLADHYQSDDRIYVFGFSRGAYTARSLAGFVSICGLIDTADLDEKEKWARVEKAYDKGYMTDKRQLASKWGKDWKFHKDSAGELPVYCVGVWDTVGALGIPNDLAILNLFDEPHKYAFHDTKLSDNIKHARHAVAMDEKRASFAPTMWSAVAHRADTVKQIWFPGVHCDVGGGYAQTGLSDGALKWMIDEVKAMGLHFVQKIEDQIQPNPQDVLHDSYKGLFSHLPSMPRSVPCVAEESFQHFHPSAIARHKVPAITQAPYRETHTPGDKFEYFTIYADQPWNDTGIFLEAGVEYAFAAKGEWLDRDIVSGPDGNPDEKKFSEIIRAAGTLLGKLEGLFKRITGNAEADFKGTRRIEIAPWFCLMGAIANGGVAEKDVKKEDIKLKPHETFPIGWGCKHTPKQSGYLYCFANDAWNFYENNRGSVTLKVKRAS